MHYTLQHEPSQIVDIDFKKPKHPLLTESEESQLKCKKQKFIDIPKPSFEEKKAFIESLQHIEPKLSVLIATILMSPVSTASNYNIPQHLPRTVFSYNDAKSIHLTETELKKKCEQVFLEMKVTREEADYLASCTTLQSESMLWYEQRKGRITASQFGAVCKTHLDPPSESLIN